TDYTTSSLLKSKKDFEYTAQMSALERVEIPDLVAEEYRLIKQEIERRETIYTRNATSSNFFEALKDVLTAIGQPTLSGLIDRLAQGVEFNQQSAEVRLNPKSEIFREIVLRRELDR